MNQSQYPSLALLLAGIVFSVALLAQQTSQVSDDGAALSVDRAEAVTGPGQQDKSAGDQAAAEHKREQEAAVRQQELMQELELRRQAIMEMQSDQGIYFFGLVEAYSDLARLQFELEDHTAASESLANALQIVRISTGLYSAQQLPLLDEMINQNLLLEAWQEVDDLVHLYHHIASRVFDQIDRNYLAAADDYGRWKLRVMQENLLRLNSQGLMGTARDLSEFYGNLLVRLDSADQVEAEDLLKLLDGKSQADMSLARSVASTPYTYFQGTANRFINETRCENRRGSNGQMVRRCYSVQVENPRYRQSQRDAKRFLLNRHSNEIVRVIERMERVLMADMGLDAARRQQLEIRIRELRTEAEQVRRMGFRGAVL